MLAMGLPGVSWQCLGTLSAVTMGEGLMGGVRDAAKALRQRGQGGGKAMATS